MGGAAVSAALRPSMSYTGTFRPASRPRIGHSSTRLITNTIRIPGWFRRLPSAERQAISQRFWAEGQLKLEPWLTQRLPERVVHRRPGTTVATCHELPSGEIDVQLSTSERLVVDHVLLATGYQANLANIDSPAATAGSH